MTEPRLDTPQATLRYTCPFPGCSRSFRDFWRLKVHYRAAPGARGSGVERGHGMELPFCPLCNLDLRDVKYHKCAAGPAACTPAARSRNNQAAGNAVAQRQVQMMPGQPMGQYMMPHNGMLPYNPHHPTSVPGPYGLHQNAHMSGPHPHMQQQQQQHNQLLPGLPATNQGSGHMQQMPGQQQHLQRSASAPDPRAVSTGIMGMPMMQHQPAKSIGQPLGKQWWRQGHMTQQQQQTAHMPGTNSGNSSSLQMPQQPHLTQQQLPAAHVQQQLTQPGLPRLSSGSGQMNSMGMVVQNRLPPVNGMSSGDMSLHRQQSWQQQAWQQQQQPKQQLGQTAAVHGLQNNMSMPPFMGSQMDSQQQQQQVQLQHTPSGSVVATGAHGMYSSSSWMQPGSFSTTAVAAAPNSGQMQPAAAYQQQQACTVPSNSSTVGGGMGAPLQSVAAQQQQQQLLAPNHSPVIQLGLELAAPSAAAALQQLPLYASKIIDDFRTELGCLRSSASGSTGGTAAEVAPGIVATDAVQQQPRNGKSSSCSNSPVSSSGIAVPDGRAVVGVKRSLSEDLGQEGTSSGAPCKRLVTDTPPPDAQEALLQLAARVESEIGGLPGGIARGLQTDLNPSSGSVNPTAGAEVDLSMGPEGGCQPDDEHAAQVSQLLGAALEAAHKCMQDPAPVVQQLLSVLDEHVSIVMAKQQHSHQQQIQHQQQPEAGSAKVPSPTEPAAGSQQHHASAFAAAAAPGIAHNPVPAAVVANESTHGPTAAQKDIAAGRDSSKQQWQAAPAAPSTAVTGAFTPSDWYPLVPPLQQQQEHLSQGSVNRSQQDGSNTHDQRSSPTVLDTLQHYHALQQQSISIPRSLTVPAARHMTESDVAPPSLPPLPPAAVKSIAQQQEQHHGVVTAAAAAPGSGSLSSSATEADVAATIAATAAAVAAGLVEDEAAVSGGTRADSAHDALAVTKALQYNTLGLGFEPGTSATPVRSSQQVSA